MAEEKTVYIVDDDFAVRKALSLSLTKRHLHVECFESAEQFLEVYQGELPACLLLDVRMKEINGLELQEILNERGIMLPIIFITGYGSVSQSVRAMKKGAIDFLEKPLNQEQLHLSIEAAFSKCEELYEYEKQHKDYLAAYESLTPREKEVLQLIVKASANITNKEIGKQLSISPRTVEIHRLRVMRKMGATSIGNLVIIIKSHNIL